jgi:hypothetical protein
MVMLDQRLRRLVLLHQTDWLIDLFSVAEK